MVRISRMRCQTRIGRHKHILYLNPVNRGSDAIIRREIVVSLQSLPESVSQISFTIVSPNACFVVATVVYDVFVKRYAMSGHLS
jgi:hypothetical protein